MGSEIEKTPEVTLLRSEIEAAAARVAERAMNTTFDGISGIVGDVFGGWFGDGVKQWRTRRLITALVLTKEHLERAGIPIENAKSLPMGEAYALFDGCSKQEDINLTKMWAGLIANAMNPSKQVFIDPSFLHVLQRLSGLDALIILYIIEFEKKRDELKIEADKFHSSLRTMNKKEVEIAIEKHQSEMEKLNKSYEDWSIEHYTKKFDSFSKENISFSISNLLRLGMIYTPEGEIPEQLISVGIDTGRDHLVADDTKLRKYLRFVRDQAGAVIEQKTQIQGIASKPIFNLNLTVPSYTLSGYCRRFLAACSP